MIGTIEFDIFLCRMHHMYIRRTAQVNKKTGKAYYTYRLVTAYRNSEGKSVSRQLSLLVGDNYVTG